MVFAHFTTIAQRLKAADDWRNDEDDGRRRRVFRGRHPLAASGRQPGSTHHDDRRVSSVDVARKGPDTRAKSMLVAFRYDNGAVGSLYYSREIPSLFRGLRLSKLFGRRRHHHVRVERALRARAGRGDSAAACFRASATSAATRRCIATSSRAIREGRRAGDEPRAGHGRSAAHGSRSTPALERACHAERTLRHHHHRKRRGRRHDGAGAGATPRRAILILERGDFVPQEDENWNPDAVWKHLRYRSEGALARRARRRVPARTRTTASAATRSSGAACCTASGARTFEAVEHVDGVSPAWPIDYDTLEPYYERAERLYHVRGQHGVDPTEPPRGPFPYAPVPHARRDGGRSSTGCARRACIPRRCRSGCCGQASGRLRAVQHVQLVSVQDRTRRATPTCAAFARRWSGRTSRCGRTRTRAGW